MAPMKVYGWAVSPWMARALVCLEEAGAEYEIVPMSRCGGDHRRPDHLARNVRISLPPSANVRIFHLVDVTVSRSAAVR
jgi:glutathione S-transferase